ncbi:MAG: sodium:proton antiporter [Halanaerobiales bacterium]|nr:sodium:proton antiporter [Halanaerobiales bacterium]
MSKTKHIFAVVILTLLGITLLTSLNKLPNQFEYANSIYHHVVNNSISETGSLNFVTAILYDYRAYDSLGESTIIFGAVSGIVLLLSRKTLPVSSHGLSFIVKRTFGMLTPFIFLFSIYIITHGHLSPGGGFQGGVILGAISIIFSIVYGSEFDYKRYSPTTKTLLETSGALLFIGLGFMGILIGGNFLMNLNILNAEVGSLLSAGSIPFINIGIGFKIGAGLAIIFYSMIQKTFKEEVEL